LKSSAEAARDRADEGGEEDDAGDWKGGGGGGGGHEFDRWEPWREGGEQNEGQEGGGWEGRQWGLEGGPDVLQEGEGEGRCDCAGCSSAVLTRMMGLMQELHRIQQAAQPARAKSYWQPRPFRVRSPQTGLQIGMVASSLAELRTQAGDALDIHYPWSVRLLLVEADGWGATEVWDEQFFATVPANSLLLALRADTETQKMVPVAKYSAREV
jgi:hypothetical protein